MSTPRTRISLTLAEVEAIDIALFKATRELMHSPRPDDEHLQEARREQLFTLISAGVKMEKAEYRMRGWVQEEND